MKPKTQTPNLSYFFSGKGYIHDLWLILDATGTKSASPVPGKCWLILGGLVSSINSADTRLFVNDKNVNYQAYFYIFFQASGGTSAVTPLFNTYANDRTQSVWCPMIVTPQMQITLNGAGANTCYAHIQVIEFDYVVE
jgi:hypothetical protein